MAHLVTIDVNDPDHAKRQKKILVGFSVRKEASGYTVSHDVETKGSDGVCCTGPWTPGERHAFEDYDSLQKHVKALCGQLGEVVKDK